MGKEEGGKEGFNVERRFEYRGGVMGGDSP
jgi:hypothetical protein